MGVVRDLIVGGVITVVIGGTAYTVSQADVVDNFANDTGMTQQQAEEYVNGVKEEDLIPYDEVGASYKDDGQQIIADANQIDCVTYEYEWESSTLTCQAGKNHLIKTGNDEVALGDAYIKLNSDSASKPDISLTIQAIDTLNADYEHEIIAWIYESATTDEIKKTNSYNKAVLKAALESN